MMCDPSTKDLQPYYQRDNHARSLPLLKMTPIMITTTITGNCTLHNSQQDSWDVGPKTFKDFKLFWLLFIEWEIDKNVNHNDKGYMRQTWWGIWQDFDSDLNNRPGDLLYLPTCSDNTRSIIKCVHTFSHWRKHSIHICYSWILFRGHCSRKRHVKFWGLWTELYTGRGRGGVGKSEARTRVWW